MIGHLLCNSLSTTEKEAIEVLCVITIISFIHSESVVISIEILCNPHGVPEKNYFYG